MDRAGAAGLGDLFCRVSLVGQPPRQSFAGISFAHDLETEIFARCVFRYHDRGCDPRRRVVRVAAVSSLRARLQCDADGRIYFDVYDWARSGTAAFAAGNHAAPGRSTHRCTGVSDIYRDVLLAYLCLDTNDANGNPGPSHFPARLFARAYAHRCGKHSHWAGGTLRSE